MRWLVVNTFFQEIDGSSQPKGWIQGNTRIGPVLEITTNCLYGKHGIEIRIWSLSEDNTHSWVRISHGSNKFVMDSNRNDTEVLELQPEEQTLQLNVKDSACRSKGKRKTARNLLGIHRASFRIGLILNQEIILSLRTFGVNFHKPLIGLTIVGKHLWQQEEERKGYINTAIMFQEKLFTSELFKDIQDATSLILHCKTMWFFTAGSSIIYTISDVRLIFILSSTMD